jgi:hypothetical protein
LDRRSPVHRRSLCSFLTILSSTCAIRICAAKTWSLGAAPRSLLRSSREHVSREKCRRAVITRWLNRWSHTAALRLVWKTDDWVRGRHCRVLGKSGSDNPRLLALFGTEFSRGQAENREAGSEFGRYRNRLQKSRVGLTPWVDISLPCRMLRGSQTVTHLAGRGSLGLSETTESGRCQRSRVISMILVLVGLHGSGRHEERGGVCQRAREWCS